MTEIGENDAFARPIDMVAKDQNVDPVRGLDKHDVLKRRDRYGPNQLHAAEKRSALVIFAHQFKGVIVWLLIFAVGLSFYYRDIAEGVAIIVVLAINAAIGFFTELRAARSMEALARMSEFATRVRRGGKVVNVDAHELVPGDIVVLEAGDMVTADLRLVQASNLQCDESVLTGESVPVAKQVDPVPPNSVIGDRTSMAFKGTAITQGVGKGIVTSTGMATELGRINHLVQTAKSMASPLEIRLDRLGHRLVWLTLVLAALVIGAGILRGHEVAVMIQTGVALAVAAVPEGLPVVATLCLAKGMWRMAARNAIISNLSSVETLGATTMILTDKTGTLTENRMTVVRYLTSDSDVDVNWSGKTIQFETGAGGIDSQTDPQLGALLRIGALCNNAALAQGDQESSGDPMEVALLRIARDAGKDRDSLKQIHEEVREHAFDQDTKMMATVHRDEDGFFYAVKGAPEAVLERCTRVLGPDGEHELDGATRAQWQDRSRLPPVTGCVCWLWRRNRLTARM